jgi:proteasome beta subunit
MELLGAEAPHLLLKITTSSEGMADLVRQVPHGTTVVGAKYADGVLLAGDRMATEGYQVAMRNIEKVYKTDEHSAMAIAGAAGPCIEMARLFRIELEHYEKIEGLELDLEGKANKLGQMIRQNLPMAMQGLVVVPIFTGYDFKRNQGRIYKYDDGGTYERSIIPRSDRQGKDARTRSRRPIGPRRSRTRVLRMVMERSSTRPTRTAYRRGTSGRIFRRSRT